MDYRLYINKKLWHVNFYVAVSNGKNRRKQLSTGIKAYDKYGREINKKLADAKAKEIVARFDGIVDNDLSTWTLDKCVKYCLESNKTKISPTTYNDYVSAINKHITPYFKNGKPLKDMKARLLWSVSDRSTLLMEEARKTSTARSRLLSKSVSSSEQRHTCTSHSEESSAQPELHLMLTSMSAW